MLMVHNTGLFGPIIQAINELKSEKDAQFIALEKRTSDAEQKHAALLKQAQQDKLAAEARAAKLEKILHEEQLVRKQQEIRLAKLEANLQRMAKRLDGQVVARR